MSLSLVSHFCLTLHIKLRADRPISVHRRAGEVNGIEFIIFSADYSEFYEKFYKRRNLKPVDAFCYIKAILGRCGLWFDLLIKLAVAIITGNIKLECNHLCLGRDPRYVKHYKCAKEMIIWHADRKNRGGKYSKIWYQYRVIKWSFITVVCGMSLFSYMFVYIYYVPYKQFTYHLTSLGYNCLDHNKDYQKTH